MTMRVPSPGRGGRIASRVATLAAAILLNGCFATTKHVKMVEADVTRKSAWTDEQVKDLEQEISQLRAENEALRVRMDDVTDRLSALGDEVGGRFTELQAADKRVSDEAHEAAQRADAVRLNSGMDKEQLVQRMNVILDEVVKENKQLRGRIEALETSGGGGGGTHTVRPGDTVASIAAKYGTTPQAIVRANDLPDADHISVGQQLTIPR